MSRRCDRESRSVFSGSIFRKVAWQGMKGNRTRTFVTVVGAMLSTALFTTIVTFGTSLMGYMADSEIAKGGNWHILFSGISASSLQEWREDEEVLESVSFENIGYTLLSGADEQSAEKPYLFVAGFTDETFEKLPVSLTSGRKPENSSEIIVPTDSIAAKAGIRIRLKDTLTLRPGEREYDGKILTQCDAYVEGEKLVYGSEHTDKGGELPVVTVERTAGEREMPAGAEEQTAGAESERAAGAERTYTVVGTFERPGFEMHESPGYTVITKVDGAEEVSSYSFYAALKNPRSVQDYGESKGGESAFAVNEDLLRFMGITENKVLNTFMYTVGGVLALIIMIGSVFLIYNSFNISLNERVHQYGILMSVGATAKQLRGAVLFEGVCIGCMGIPAGIAAGIGCVSLLLPVVEKNFANILNSGEGFGLTVSFQALALAALFGFITILISAWLPAKKAVKRPIMDCIRGSGEIKLEAKKIRISKGAWKRYGLEGTLALKNFKRNRKKYRSIVLSLTLSVVLTVAGSTFGTAVKKLTGTYTGQAADGDIQFVTDDMTEEEFDALYRKMEGTEGISRSTWQADYLYRARTDELPEDFLASYRAAMGDSGAGSGQEVTLYTQFIDDGIYQEYVESVGLPAEEYMGPDGKILNCVMDSVEHVTLFEGQSMNFVFRSAADGAERTVCTTFENSYPLDGICILEGDPVYVFNVTAPLSMKERFAGFETVDDKVHLGAFFWCENPTETLRQIQALLLTEEIMANYNLYNVARAFELYRNADFIIDIFTWVFVFMISLIAVANVFNTISTNIRLRRRELAMLRSVGMSDRGFNRMMRFECAFYGMRTLFVGIPIALLLSWMIHTVIMSVEELDIAFTVPWGALGISIIEVFGIVFVTMAYAVGKIRKENIIDALRDEMT